MKTNIAQRLEKILMQDKSVDPLKYYPALKSDIRDIIREYAELYSDINLEVQENLEGYNIVMVASIKRFKA